MKKKKNVDLVIRHMAEDLMDPTLSVVEIVDSYVKCATPELRKQLIDKVCEIRKKKLGIG